MLIVLRLLSTLPALVLLTACTMAPKHDAAAELALLETMMLGTFDSVDQAHADREHFRPVSLLMVPVSIAGQDGRWLYVEQALIGEGGRSMKPYRQRVYHLESRGEGWLRSTVYAVPTMEDELASAWAAAGALPLIEYDRLVLREGCHIELMRTADDRFQGATQGQDCASSLLGASYATSEVTITPVALTSWDRGWNREGEQVWGATKGAYRFVKRSASAPAKAQP